MFPHHHFHKEFKVLVVRQFFDTVPIKYKCSYIHGHLSLHYFFPLRFWYHSERYVYGLTVRIRIGAKPKYTCTARSVYCNMRMPACMTAQIHLQNVSSISAATHCNYFSSLWPNYQANAVIHFVSFKCVVNTDKETTIRLHVFNG